MVTTQEDIRSMVLPENQGLVSDNRFSTKIGQFVCLFVCLSAFREKLRKHDEQFISKIVISLEVHKNYQVGSWMRFCF